MINLEIGGIVVTDTAGFNITQRYSTVDGGSTLLRSMNGTGIKQTRWEKVKISTSGTGWIPSALQTLDFDLDITMKCVSPMHSQSASNVIVIPTERRTDTGAEPFGMAYVNDDWVDSPASLLTNTVTVTAVAGATLYRACWYPEYTVSAKKPDESGNLGEPNYTWTFEAEQV